MKNSMLRVGATFILSAATLWAATPGEKEGALQVYPKNYARQHLGSNVFLYNPNNQTFVPTEAGAAWLDDDIATGWPPATGHQYYMLALPEAELITSFEISARASGGTISLYAGDEAAGPSAKSWVAVAKDVPVESINQKKLGSNFSRFAKYLLIETNLTETGPWYSIYLYGEKPAISYSLLKRDQPLNAQSIFKFVNDQTTISLASLYTQGRVVYVNSEVGAVEAQKAIDDNPESSVALAASENEAGMIVRFKESRAIQRVSALTDMGTKGRLDFYLVATLPKVAAAGGSNYIQAANSGTETAGLGTTPFLLADLKPAGSITLDGSNPRGSADFSTAKAEAMLVRWVPDTPGQTLALREVNSFGESGVTNSQLAAPADAVGEIDGYDSSKDGKTALGGKDVLPPVGELLPPKTPFSPGAPINPPRFPLTRGTTPRPNP